MRILILGGGGREHALGWALRRSPRVTALFFAPGNGGTRALGENLSVDPTDPAAVVAAAREHRIDRVVVGPEAPLAAGVVDALEAAGIPAFGPTRAAARLEASKAFARAFCRRHGIPVPEFRVFEAGEAEEAVAFARSLPDGAVVKADGLAGGKGAFVCDTAEEAEGGIRRLLVEGALGEAGRRIVVERRLRGPEVSLLAFTDGRRLALCPAARDHKRLLDGDRGPNTGGMGAYAPVPELAPAQVLELAETFLAPAVAGMAAEGRPYRGVLYAGLILDPSGPYLLEYNARMGDPEAQVLLPLLETDLLEVVEACLEGQLDPARVRWREGAAATVVAAAQGYPQAPRKGDPIEGVAAAEALEGVYVFHAGTAWREGRLVTAGGRVLAVTGLGADLKQALERAYAGLARIAFPGMQFRRDIGASSLGKG